MFCIVNFYLNRIYVFNISAFKMIEGNHAYLMRAVYTLGNLVGLALAVYKCQVMGLLPTHPSDWLAFVEPQRVSICKDIKRLTNCKSQIMKMHSPSYC